MNALNPVLNLRAQLTMCSPSTGRRCQAERSSAPARSWTCRRQPDRLTASRTSCPGDAPARDDCDGARPAAEPDLMDEPTTALDVVTQRQIMEELADLRRELGFRCC